MITKGAITYEPGNIIENKTGGWRTLKPIMPKKAAPCTLNCPALIQIPQYFEKIINGIPDGDRLKRICQKYLFKYQSRRNPGQEDRTSFLRKGIAGDWKNYFGREAREVFHHYAGNQLIRLGYERDDSWV